MSAPLSRLLGHLQALGQVDATPLHRGAQRAAGRVTRVLAQRGVRAGIQVVPKDDGVLVHVPHEHAPLLRSALRAEHRRIGQELRS